MSFLMYSSLRHFEQLLLITSYQDGLERVAIYVSDGGGAPRNFEKEVIEKFIDGKHFLPVSKGTLFNRNIKATDAIGPRLFYSQSGMFVQYIAENKPLLFE